MKGQGEEEPNGENPVHIDRYSVLGQLMTRNAAWLAKKFPGGDFDPKCVRKENGVGEENRWIACKAKHEHAISVAYMEMCEMKRPTMWVAMKDVKIPELKMPAPGTPGCDTIEGCFKEWERLNLDTEESKK